MQYNSLFNHIVCSRGIVVACASRRSSDQWGTNCAAVPHWSMLNVVIDRLVWISIIRKIQLVFFQCSMKAAYIKDTTIGTVAFGTRMNIRK